MDETVTLLKEQLTNARQLVASINEAVERVSTSFVRSQENMDELRAMYQVHFQKNSAIVNALEKIGATVERIEEKLDKITENKKILCEVGTTVKIAVEKTTGSTKRVGSLTVPHFMKCQNTACGFEFPKEMPLRDDGVTVECSKCNCLNIVDILKTGYKWMFIPECNHFVQFPIDKEEGEREKCIICGIEGKQESIRRCQNRGCQFNFPRNMQLREDGVSLKCPGCKCYNIVGKLKENHKWMITYGCFHYQQFPLYKREAQREKCVEVCGFVDQLYEIRIGPAAKSPLKCQNSRCDFEFTYSIPLREDGVTVECRECKQLTLAGEPKYGFKWMCISACNHFVQFPKEQVEGELNTCHICGNCGKLESPLKCWGCNCIITKPFPLREDGVTINCPVCHNLVIVGKLEQGHKWMCADICGHFQQALLNQKNGEKRRCQICGKKAKHHDNNDSDLALQC